MKERNTIEIKGAKTHNLKNIDLSIPRDKFIIITGMSGSGKSSLAFDTIFAEGQRKYVESLSTYARQFLRQLQKPAVEEITGLSPAISIDQKSRSNNPRSTVSTITEIYDYLRVLYSKSGTPYCYKCNERIQRLSKDEVINVIKKRITTNKWLSKTSSIKKSFDERSIEVYAPVVIGRKGEYYQLLYNLLHKGYESLRINKKVYDLRKRIVLKRTTRYDIDALVNTLFLKELAKSPKLFNTKLSDALDKALVDAKGVVRIKFPDGKEEVIAANFTCYKCGFAFPEIEPRFFSFNSPYGACPECRGIGRVDIFSSEKCKECNGSRLRKEALSIYINDGTKELNIVEFSSLSIEDADIFINKLNLTAQQKEISKTLISEIKSRLGFLKNVGLEYLALDRTANTLSGGEAQRIRLASQLGSGLVGALYVLDEPTIGLHQSDNERLISTLLNLRDLGNTIIVVEHDEETILASDYLVDIGPKAGINGGEVIVSGYTDKLLTAKTNPSKSVTLDYLRGVKKIKVPKERRKTVNGFIELKEASHHNIAKLNVKFPLNTLTIITGVSGSGKSTLMHDLFYENVKRYLYRKKKTDSIKELKGAEAVLNTILIDQSPIGRTPRSVPITYIGGFSMIRELFALTEEARYRGYGPSYFSFNVPSGRCEKCQGNSVISIDMHFLPTIYVGCDVCHGRRYTEDVLEIKYNGKNIFDVLEMSVDEAYEFFKTIPKLNKKLFTLKEVGLGYIKLGQPSTTLSGGEAQRVKIAAELGRPNNKKTLYFLDEPTIGLHYEDVDKLIEILNKLVTGGNSVVVIEHNLDVIKNADYILDMGPLGGVKGGKIVASGTPEKLAESDVSLTAKYLKKSLKNDL